MSLAQVSMQFLLQFGFGSLVTFLITDRRALGPKYDKFGGWVLVAAFGLVGSLVWGPALEDGAGAGERLLGVAVAAAALGTLAFASLAGWTGTSREGLLLWPTLAAAAVAVGAAALIGRVGSTDRASAALTLAGAFGSALVLGFTTWGMILGHWYLVSQGLAIRHLARLVTPLPWLLLGKALVSGLALWLLWSAVLGPGNRTLGDVMARSPERVLDVVNVWARIPVGLLAPVVLAFMTRVTVRMERTQPATGILYAMCVLVYLGELMGKMVEGSTGVPL
jgi:hypothetical protein